MHQIAQPAATSASSTVSPPKAKRLVSLDAYRGFVMLLMMAGLTLGLRSVAQALPGSAFWAFLAHHQSHVDWLGCSLHDLIQPSFSFIVGVALPFSIASRLARGQPMGKLTLHAAWRSLLLVFLGVFLRVIAKHQTLISFTDTLAQIGFGYTFLFLLGFGSPRTQWITFGLILLGYWLVFALYPVPGDGFDYAKVGVTPKWFAANGLHGFAAHWNMNSNAAWAFDTWFLNLFPQEHRFEYNSGATCTLNFIPTLATMILGLLTGQTLRSDRTPTQKVLWIVGLGMVTLAAGWTLDALGVCPSVKKLWTPSWILFSGGWCLLLMALFYLVIDIWNWQAWSFPLVVIGLNSIAAYVVVHLMEIFLFPWLRSHLGKNTFRIFGPAYEPLLFGACMLLMLWLILWLMYRRKFFVRI